MSHHENLKILAFVGLTGSGKSTAVEHFTTKGYPRVYFGGIVLEAVKQAGLEINPANEQTFREDLREKEGKDFIVKRIISQIHDLADAGQHRIVADGLYTWTEYKALKKEFPGELSVVAIVSAKHLRHHRLETREVRPLTNEEASHRDWSEIENLEKGGPIAIADYYVANNENVEHFYKQLDDIAAHVEF
jgi:dephospho-CoA kinase